MTANASFTDGVLREESGKLIALTTGSVRVPISDRDENAKIVLWFEDCLPG